MAKSKSMFQKPLFWIAFVAVIVAAFVLTEPDATKPGPVAKKTTKRSRSVKKTDEVFTKEDETASFKPVNSQARNSFVPIVARHSGIGSADGLANAIPADMTGGDGNWVYTGTAETDGERVALVENRSTGDAVFLKRGERWKSAYVVQISEYSVILRGPSGTRTLGLVDESLKTSGSAIAQAGPQGFSPARVNGPQDFRGPIGRNGQLNGFSVTPDAASGQGALPGFPGNDPNQ